MSDTISNATTGEPEEVRGYCSGCDQDAELESIEAGEFKTTCCKVVSIPHHEPQED